MEPGGRILSQHDVDGKVLHCGIQDLLHLAIEPVDLVHEQHVALLEVVEDRRHLSGLFDGRTGGDLQIHSHFVGDDPAQRRFSQSRRAVK